MEPNTRAFAYWTLAKRMRAHRESNPMIVPLVMSEMHQLAASSGSEAVRLRVNRFLADNRGDATVTSTR